jgi:PAS domain S-box-containing protein
MSSASILVVEDEAIVALDLSQRLTRLGYRVIATVDQGEKAVAATLTHNPDLVLMDLRLAGAMDGIAAAQQIAQVADVPIVFLTAHSDPETLARACLTGPFGYILKPFNERELHTQLEIALYRHGAERRVRESEAQLRAVMNTAQDGILAIDKAGMILSTNPGGEEIFGYGAGEMIGLDAGELMPSLHVMIDNDDDQGFVKTRGGSILSAVREVSGKRKDGALLPLEITLSKRNDRAQRNYIGIVRNISRRKQLENKLKGIVDDLRESDRRKDEFLATLSHELRNPLAPIRSVSDILKSMVDIVDPKFHWCCEILDRQMDLVTRLMEDLLDVGRISRGSLILHKEWVDFREIVRTLIAACSPEVDAAGHKLVVDVPDNDIKMFVDPVRVTQVLSNLVNNAVKYTDGHGEVRFIVQSQRDEIVIQVQDSGIGISADFLPSVFQMFRQADSSLERNRGGLGIGLALVKSLVELHGGSVEASSLGLGQGSVFTVRLPVAPVSSIAADMLPAAAEKDRRPAPTPRSKRILIVDDNKLQAQSLGILVQLWGYEVRLAYDGPSALAALGEYSADVALIDIGLPGISGYEVARQIREQPQWRHMTLIAQTGWGRDSDRDKSEQAGFDHHFTKPLNHNALEKVLVQTAAQNIGASMDFVEIHSSDPAPPMKSS